MNPESSPLTPNSIPPQPAPTEAPVAASPMSEAAAVATPLEASQPMAPGIIDATDPSPLKQIRTYQGDIAEAIKSQNASVYSIREAERARAELLKKREADSAPAAPAVERTPMSEETKRRIISVLLTLGGFALFAGASLAGYLAYEHYSEKTAVPVVEIPKNRFLPVVGTKNLDASTLTRQALITTLADERSKTLPDGNIMHVQLMKGGAASSTLMTPSEFMLLLNARIPSSLVRALNPLFMLGVLGQPTITIAQPVVATTTATSTATTTKPTATSTASTTPSIEFATVSDNQTVLLMKLDSFDNTYAGMLGWEPSMREDLLPLFHSSETALNVPDDGFWTDVTIKNKDARVLRDTSGKTRLIYSFYNQNLLIITGSEGALKTIITALDTQALAR